jgi:hypothetical protein
MATGIDQCQQSWIGRPERILSYEACSLSIWAKERVNEKGETRFAGTIGTGQRPRAADVAASHGPANTVQHLESAPGRDISLHGLAFIALKVGRTQVVLAHFKVGAELLG